MGKAPGLWLEGEKKQRQADDWATEVSQSRRSGKRRGLTGIGIKPFTSTRIAWVQFNTLHAPLKCTRSQIYSFDLYSFFLPSPSERVLRSSETACDWQSKSCRPRPTVPAH